MTTATQLTSSLLPYLRCSGTDATAVGKFPGNPALLKQGDVEGQTFYNMTKAFRVAEMYLIAAEAQYNLNQTEGGFLNTLRQKRGASATQATGDALFQVIKDEWAREMCGEGFRLDCLKRWGDGFTRMPAQQLEDGFLNTQPGFQNLTVTADNFRFIWEIPFRICRQTRTWSATGRRTKQLFTLQTVLSIYQTGSQKHAFFATAGTFGRFLNYKS